MKIFFVSAGSGGSEIINIINKELAGVLPSCKISTIALTLYAKEKLDSYEYVKPEDIITYLKLNKPSVVINERSNDLELQNSVTDYCVKNNILNMIKNYWCKY